MAGTSETKVWADLLVATAENWHPRLEDQISTSNAFLKRIMRNPNTYRVVTGLGQQMDVPLMYELPTFGVYDDADPLDTNKHEGIKKAYYPWRQAQIPIVITGKEQRMNKAKYQRRNLLKDKLMMAEIGIRESFAKAIIQGDGANGNSIETPWTDPTRGRAFVDPLFLMIKLDPTTGAVGGINPAVDTWWVNQIKASAATTYAGVAAELRTQWYACKNGPGGAPDLHLVDQNTAMLYEAILAASHRNPSYRDADIPVTGASIFRGATVQDEEFMPCVEDGDTTLEAAKGSWCMLNTAFFQIQVDSSANFTPQDEVRTGAQDAIIIHLLWMGGFGMMNRRKHSVHWGIDTTMVA